MQIKSCLGNEGGVEKRREEEMMEIIEGEERPGEAGEVSMVSDIVNNSLCIRNGGSGVALVTDHEPKELLGGHLAPTIGERGEGVFHIGWGLDLVVSKAPLEAEEHLIAPHLIYI